jgi:hypothetical protein
MSKVKIVETAKRHVIKVNDIAANKNRYLPKSVMKSRELINSPVNTIAFFCNEYVPEHLQNREDSIKYILTVNGTDHEIIPINAIREGKKIIRTTNYGQESDYSIYINESIKSAKLTVLINAESYDSPYVSNIKILIGGN